MGGAATEQRDRAQVEGVKGVFGRKFPPNVEGGLIPNFFLLLNSGSRKLSESNRRSQRDTEKPFCKTLPSPSKARSVLVLCYTDFSGIFGELNI